MRWKVPSSNTGSDDSASCAAERDSGVLAGLTAACGGFAATGGLADGLGGVPKPCAKAEPDAAARMTPTIKMVRMNGPPLSVRRAIAAYGSTLRLRLQRPRLGARAVAAGAGGRYRGVARRGRLDHRFAARSLAQEQILDLVAGERLEFEQPLGQGLQIAALVSEDLLRLGIAGFDQTPDLGVDLLHGGFGDTLLARHRIAEEDFFLVLPVCDSAERVRQAPARHHHAREFCRLLDVGCRARRHAIATEHQFLGDATTH